MRIGKPTCPACGKEFIEAKINANAKIVSFKFYWRIKSMILCPHCNTALSQTTSTRVFNWIYGLLGLSAILVGQVMYLEKYEKLLLALVFLVALVLPRLLATYDIEQEDE